MQAYADAFQATSTAVPGTPIPAPDTVAATPDDGRATVTWNLGPGATAVTGFRIYVGLSSSVSTSGTPAASISHADARSLVVVKDGHGDPLVNGTKYFFRVVSISANGKAASTTSASATPVKPPAAPTSLTATASSGQILLTWVSTGANTTGYNIFRANGNNPTSRPPERRSTRACSTRPSRTTRTCPCRPTRSYTYVIVAVGPSHTAVSPKATAKTPAVNNGPTASGWGGSLAPTNLDWPAGPVKTALGSQLTDFRYVFNRIGTTNVDKTDTLHVKPWSDLTLKNNGGSPVTISSLSLTGAYSIAFARQGVGTAGADVDLPLHHWRPAQPSTSQIQFDYCRTCSASNLPVKGVQYGVLTVNSNDPGHTAATLPLAGAWQATAGGADELPLTTFINQVLGIPTHLTGGTDSHGVYKGINYGNGLVAAVGEEVLSPYWQSTGGQRRRPADRGHAQRRTGTSRSVVPPGQPRLDERDHAAGGHRLPDLAPRREQRTARGGQLQRPAVRRSASASTPGSTADWSDDTLNQGPTLANDIRHGCTRAVRTPRAVLPAAERHRGPGAQHLPHVRGLAGRQPRLQRRRLHHQRDHPRLSAHAPRTGVASRAMRRTPVPLSRSWPESCSPASCRARADGAAQTRKPLTGIVIAIDPGHNGGNSSHPKQVNRKVWIGNAWKVCNTVRDLDERGLCRAPVHLGDGHGS